MTRHAFGIIAFIPLFFISIGMLVLVVIMLLDALDERREKRARRPR